MTDHESSRQRVSGTTPAATHLSAEQRVKIGKDARARAPRSSHAEFRPTPDRRTQSACSNARPPPGYPS